MLLSGTVQSQPINHQVHVNYQASTFYYTNYTHCYSLHPPIDSLIEILAQKKINHVNGKKVGVDRVCRRFLSCALQLHRPAKHWDVGRN